MSTIGDITVKEIINRNARTYSGRGFLGGSPEGVTMHETANLRATAEQNARFFASMNPPRGTTSRASVHFFVDENEVVQSLPLTLEAWHAGDGYNGKGNRTTIAIEVCVNGDVVAAWKRTIELVRALRANEMVGDGLYFHQHWSGKLCPALLLQRTDVYRAGERRETARTRANTLVKAGLDRDAVVAAIRADAPAEAPVSPTSGVSTQDGESVQRAVKALNTAIGALVKERDALA